MGVFCLTQRRSNNGTMALCTAWFRGNRKLSFRIFYLKKFIFWVCVRHKKMLFVIESLLFFLKTLFFVTNFVNTISLTINYKNIQGQVVFLRTYKAVTNVTYFTHGLSLNGVSPHLVTNHFSDPSP